MNHKLLRDARKKAKLTQEDLAKELGVNRATVSKYEAGSILPTLKQITRISEVLGVSLSDLVWEGEGPAPAPTHAIATPHGSYIISAEEHEKRMKEGAGSGTPQISDDDIMFALWGGDREITAEDLEEVKRFAAFIRQRKKKENPPQDES